MTTTETTTTTTTTKENTTMKKPTTAHQNATAVHAAAVEKVTEVARLLEATEADLSALEAVDATQLLADPSKAAQVAEGRARLSQLQRIHTEMLEAAQKAVADAVRGVVAMEAEEMQPAIRAAEADLEKWQAREAELLDALEAHTNLRYVRPQHEAGAATMRGTFTTKAPSDSSIKTRVRLLKAQQAALVAASEGRDPAEVCEVDQLPESLQAGGICPSPRAVAKAQRDAERAAEEAAVAAEDAADDERLAEACSTLGIDPEQAEKLERQWRPQPDAVTGWRRDAELAMTMRAPGQDFAAVLDALAVLAELSGIEVANSVLVRVRVKQPEPAAS